MMFCCGHTPMLARMASMSVRMSRPYSLAVPALGVYSPVSMELGTATVTPLDTALCDSAVAATETDRRSHCGRLAGAVVAQEAVDLVLVEVEGETVDGRLLAKHL